MLMEGQIVADLSNKQLVAYMGLIEKHDPYRIHAVYMDEEKFKSTGKKVTLNDCIVGIKATHIHGLPIIYNDFDKAKSEIKKAGKVYAVDKSVKPNQIYGISVDDNGNIMFDLCENTPAGIGK